MSNVELSPVHLFMMMLLLVCRIFVTVTNVEDVLIPPSWAAAGLAFTLGIRYCNGNCICCTYMQSI